jgi:DNA polymerase-3 subunit epsilon
MYAIIDTETTGLSLKNDRIIELAVIGLDANVNKEWEWCSLINPERDTGQGMAVRIHQIYSRDVRQRTHIFRVCGTHRRYPPWKGGNRA